MESPKLKITLLNVDELVPYANNAKKHTEKQVAQIVESMSQFGNCDPIAVWHNKSGQPEVVEGHGRLLALKELGVEKAPCICLDHLDDEGNGVQVNCIHPTQKPVGLMAHLLAEKKGEPVELSCAIGDEAVGGIPYEEIVEIARKYIQFVGGFEKFAEWGLIRND